jgi:hypothetical protein
MEPCDIDLAKSNRRTLKFCQIDWDQEHICVSFPDGTYINATPHSDDPHYHVIANRLGYGDNLFWYALEHEFCHAFLEERIYNRPSNVLWSLAHNIPLIDSLCAYEEIAVQTFQRWLRAGEQPIVGGVDWIGLKNDALQRLAI